MSQQATYTDSFSGPTRVAQIFQGLFYQYVTTCGVTVVSITSTGWLNKQYVFTVTGQVANIEQFKEQFAAACRAAVGM